MRRVPYYFFNFQTNDHRNDWIPGASISNVHYSLFVEPMLTNFDLKSNMESWMQSQHNTIEKFDINILSALGRYCGSDYEEFWDEYNKSRGVVTKDHPKALQDFDRAFTMQKEKDMPSLPIGIRLFEGQGRNEDDISNLVNKNRNKFSVGTIIERFRPTSTSWVPNAALDFLGFPKYDASLYPSSINQYHGAKEIAFAQGRYSNDGCLVVYTIRDSNVKAIFRQIMEHSIFEEAEVLIQPRVRLVVTRIDYDVEMPRWNCVRRAVRNERCKCTVVWMDMEALDINNNNNNNNVNNNNNNNN
jgi:hypothetical protein